MNKLIRNTLLALSIFVIGCEDNQEIYDDIDLVYNINLPVDDNGYYHMELSDSWQTIERVTANLESKHLDNREYGERDLVETIKVYWESSHYWVMNATLGFLKELGIPFQICAGTALGAFRSGKFIPGDDDIDIHKL